MRSQRYSYGDFLREIRDQPGSGLKVLAFCALAMSLTLHSGLEYGLIVAGCSVAGVLTFGYPVWRWLARRRARR